MEKVNIRFHDNYTVTYQHKKILQFVPELSVDRNVRVMTPNIPLLVSVRHHLQCAAAQCLTGLFIVFFFFRRTFVVARTIVDVIIAIE